MTPLSHINKAFFMLIQQERNLFAPSKEDKLVANFAQPQMEKNQEMPPIYPSYGRGKALKICSLCHKLRHIIDVCFKKNGLPPHLKRTNMAQAYPPTNMEVPSQSISMDFTHHSTKHIGFTTELSYPNFV